MICPKCGAKTEDNARFCVHCPDDDSRSESETSDEAQGSEDLTEEGLVDKAESNGWNRRVGRTKKT